LAKPWMLPDILVDSIFSGRGLRRLRPEARFERIADRRRLFEPKEMAVKAETGYATEWLRIVLPISKLIF
jgi:hypothetical protein